jgi:hypothetical protein
METKRKAHQALIGVIYWRNLPFTPEFEREGGY